MFDLPEIEYGRGVDRHQVLSLALAGHPVLVRSDAAYYSLFHVLDRSDDRDVFTLLRKRVADDSWIVFAVKKVELAGLAGRN